MAIYASVNGSNFVPWPFWTPPLTAPCGGFPD
jgi:hypothetical protein